jgi:hypothetical protein
MRSVASQTGLRGTAAPPPAGEAVCRCAGRVMSDRNARVGAVAGCSAGRETLRFVAMLDANLIVDEYARGDRSGDDKRLSRDAVAGLVSAFIDHPAVPPVTDLDRHLDLTGANIRGEGVVELLLALRLGTGLSR